MMLLLPLIPLIIVLMVNHSDARTHSLRYFRLGVSDPGPGIPEFISVGYMDSHPITTYDSVTRRKESRAPWMVENLPPDHWERHTQLLRGWQQMFLTELKNLQSHYNHSGGFHTFQRMIGCELLEDGSTTGFLQYAYDGQDFIIFQKDTLSWIAVDSVAQITKRAWEANRHELQYQKNWLETECIAWLKRYLEYGKDTLQRTEPPLVRVNRQETSPGITTLFCRAHGFYPPEISMIWMRDGEEIIQEIDYGDILPSGDGTYQTWISVEMDSQSSNIYSCHVQHCDRHMVLQVPEESETILLVMKAISGSIVLAIILAGIGILAWRRRPRDAEAKNNNNNNNNNATPLSSIID
ncbi:major histocompatibility complex class I-related gene protein isoform X1 [Trichechus manatus latirostris]|uniref:Major histocompatibility complex class I-related gene protein isoform X1 n=1 Tax=Trichechus manatus latirostris TaxID=127582 RepID=A0A2Y9QWV9_TRIMA|nr:major histocompatibility complex class I-related gene protein isoform X1 [Trichechus manatus latirostris]